MVNRTPTPMLQGTLDLLILKALMVEKRHGLGIVQRIEEITRGAYTVSPGSLFPALHKLEESGALRSSWGTSTNNRRAKFYELTAAGRKQLRSETAEWRRVAGAMSAALESA